MADQKIGVILDFKVNTSQAKQSMTQLQQLLTQISTGTGVKVDSGSIVSASKAAKELAYHLSAAYNADTGKLDLGKLNASLNSAKANIGDLSSKLLSAGKTGQAAFVQLAKSMSMAEAPAFKLNGVVSKLWTSLKNVATWQISSTVLMGLTNSISEAYQFAQDLNESLTEIRIVTGNSAEDMQRFAKEANKAAKALSTTTTKYTDASLIYFQQGLNEQQVKERTDLTIKMANVTGQSVSEVSDQLTAVWNNFDNGTKSLEYYVDVMTALGAATASSSEEISEGLNKFAAVAETVGLSYEYAAAALTTVTATTRQSADVVGTAFKTLFARIQDLELGETLDDGTTMGQYSQALAAVGINIKDVNGEVKDMNIILDEMGAKWNTLTKDTQIALAQNVAGVRQYTQLIALMDNWSYFQENLNTAYSSTGELQKQADIYAESWEAARDRVTANLEDIYQDVLKDDFFIDFLNGIADIIEGVDTFIEKLGGIEPIIISLSSLLLNSISNKIQPALYGIISSIRSITSTGAAKEAAAASQPFISKIDTEIATGNYNQSDRTALENSKQLLQVKNKLWVATKDMTEAEKQMVQIDLELLENEQSKLQVIADTITKLEQEVAKQEQLNVAAKMQIQQTTKLKQEESELQSRVSETKRQYEEQLQIIRTYPKKIADAEAEVTHLNQILNQTKPNTDAWNQLSSRIQDIKAQIEAMYLAWENAETVVGDNKIGFGADYEQAISDLEAFRTANENTAKTVAVIGDAMVRAYQQAGQEAVKAGADAVQAFEEGRAKISLSGVSKSFFAQNQSSFADLSIEDDLEATRVGAAKTQIGTLQDMLGSDTIGQVEGLSDLFNDADVASSGQELQQIIEQIKAALDAASVSAESFEKAISDFGEIGKKSIEEVKKPITELNKQHQALVKKQQELNIQAAKFNPKHYASGTEVFAKMTSGITSAVMALNGLNAITKQLKENGPPDSFDEWMSIITSLTFVAPQLVNAYKAIGGALTSLSGPIAANNALMATQLYTIDAAGNKIPAMTVAELYNAAAKKAGAEATEEQIKAEIAALAVSQGLIGANGAEAFSESVLTAAKQKGTIWSKIQAAADKGNAIAKGLLAIATKLGIVTINAETGAVVANTAAWYANPIMWIALVIVGVVAALGALVFWIVKSSGALEKEKTALEKATEAAKNQQKALESITEAAEEMNTALQEAKDLIASYAEVSDAFDGLIKGSDAYNENLQKEIELVNQLLDKYPELLEMGIIGFQDGRYQVLDENMLQQYVVGTATVDKLSMDLAKMYAKEDTEIANEQVRYTRERDEVLKQKKEQRQLTIGAVTGRNFTISDGAGNQWTIDNSDIPAQRGSEEAINGRRYSVGSTFEAWEERMSKGESFDDLIKNNQSEYNKQLLEAFKGYMNAAYDYTNKLSDLNEEHLNNLAEINKKYEQQYKILGSQILSYQKGYSDLNQYQQAAASQQVGAQLAANNKKYEFKTGYGVDFNQDLANYILKATGVGGTWSEYGVVNEKNDKINDIGDFFVNTVAGTEAVAAYLRDVKGYSDMTRDMLNNDGYEFDTTGMKSGDDSKYDIELDWSEIAAYYQGKAIYESIDYEAAMEAAAKRSNAANAAIGGTIGALSEKDIRAIASGSRETGYTLDTSSKAFQEARMAMGTMSAEEEASWIANLKQQLADYDAALAETLLMQQEMQEGNLILAESAEKYGLNADVVKNYAQSLYDANKAQGMTYTAAVNLAVANSRLAKGLETLRDDWIDISDTLNTASKDSYEWMEAATEAQKALTDMFGVSVSLDFIDKYKQQIGTLVEGGEEAVKVFQELEVAAGQDYIMSLAIDDEYKTEFKSMLEQLTEQETPEMTVGIKGEIDASYIESLNKLLAEGAITADEVNAMFNSIGWDPNITTKPGDPVTNSSMSVITTGESFDPVTGDPMGDGTKSWQKIETTTTPQVPVIGDVTSAPKSSSDIKTTTTSGSSKASKKKSIGRYHEIKEELADLQQELNKISKAKENAFGANRIALMDQELSKQQELIDAEKEYYKQIEDYYAIDRKNLDSRFKIEEGTGRILNYTEALKSLIDSGISGDAYEKIKEAADQYTETLNELEAQQQVVNDAINTQKDMALETIEYQVELKVKVNDLELKKLEWQLKHLKDPIKDAEDAIRLLGDSTEKTIGNLHVYRQGIKDILGEDLYKAYEENGLAALENINLTDKQISALENYQEQLYSTADAMDEFYSQIMEKVNGAFEGYNEEFDEYIEDSERYKAVADTYLNVIALVGTKASGVSAETVKALRRASFEASKTQLTTLKEQLSANEAMLASAQTERDKYATDSEEYKYWDEQVEAIQEKVYSLKDAVQSAWTDTLQEAADAFASSVEDVTSAFEEAMTGTYGTYEKMQKMFDQQKEISDRYVDNYKQIYELSKLNRDITKSMDSIDSVAGKEALRDLQEEINTLQENGTEMSEYDLEYLRKKYDLRVAEIALEEAQNAKSQVRMQRDAEGNWGYVYTADEEKTADTQQNYEDKLYAIQEHSQNYMDQMEQKVIETEQRMLQEISGLRAQDFESEEAYQAEIERITKYYTEQRNYYLNELNKAIGNSSTVYHDDWLSYDRYNGKKLDADKGWRDQFNEIALAQIGDYESIEDARSKFDTAISGMLTSLTGSFKQWQTDVHDAFTAADEDFNAFGGENGTAATTASNTVTALNGISTKLGTLANDAKTGFEGITEAANNEIKNFQTALTPYKTEVQSLIDLINEAIKKQAEMESSNTEDDNTGYIPGGTGGNSGGRGGGGDSTIWDSKHYTKKQVKAIQEFVGTEVDGYWGKNSQAAAASKGFKSFDEVISAMMNDTTAPIYYGQIDDAREHLTSKGQKYIQLTNGKYVKVQDAKDNILFSQECEGATNTLYFLDEEKIKQLTSLPTLPLLEPVNRDIKQAVLMDTGGYTGEWDSSGRLAVLHQKEIVLNARDTENFLSAINIVRDIASLIDLRAAAQQSALSMMSATSIAPTTQTLQQEVTIHAEFPNATQRTEIEAAFDTLLNRASQFANRKN